MVEENNTNDKNITWFKGRVTSRDREKLHGHKGCVIWFTGLSASGKSTISHYLEKMLHDSGCSSYVFDGDNVRHGLCKDLGFTREDREENIRRIGEMVKLFIDAGIIAITAFISPYRKDRDMVRSLVGNDFFVEVYVQCPVDICIKRDPKGVYAKALAGKIDNFTGVSAPYEAPDHADIVVNSEDQDFFEAAGKIFDFMKEKQFLKYI